MLKYHGWLSELVSLITGWWVDWLRGTASALVQGMSSVEDVFKCCIAGSSGRVMDGSSF